MPILVRYMAIRCHFCVVCFVVAVARYYTCCGGNSTQVMEPACSSELLILAQCRIAEGCSTVNLHHRDNFKSNMKFSCILKDLETICYLKLVQCVIAVKFPRLSAGSRRNVLPLF